MEGFCVKKGGSCCSNKSINVCNCFSSRRIMPISDTLARISPIKLWTKVRDERICFKVVYVWERWGVWNLCYSERWLEPKVLKRTATASKGCVPFEPPSLYIVQYCAIWLVRPWLIPAPPGVFHLRRWRRHTSTLFDASKVSSRQRPICDSTTIANGTCHQRHFVAMCWHALTSRQFHPASYHVVSWKQCETLTCQWLAA